MKNDNDSETVCEQGRQDEINTQGGGSPAQLAQGGGKREARKAKARARWKRWYHNNKVNYAKRHTEYQKLWRKKNPDYYRIYLKNRYASNPKRGAAYQLAYQQRNPAKAKNLRLARQRKYYADPSSRAAILHLQHKRDAEIHSRALPDAKTAIKRIAAQKSVACFYCGKRMRPKKAHIEHINPIINGGAHAAYNIVPACPHCNEVKQRRHANEFIRNGQLILVY